ncbi:oxygen-independent coproporphyrinogen-3 oxidase [Dysgonomonas sp. PH5-45]|uniref:radical SAM family heme chaperone HemW n=1 Tax=unclassified Dysgonomonas TaxID=2630389 RepID=UPI002476A662|nr:MULTISPECIES: radical SAM family heme chaperone HemW [unclassified Dysgonomonas]MDH6355344.1 oxygen-independent coproporphyrinogen-3 oxidase [Dysgonomonas sp. PH5-45]MDH6388242.1 oxygen-independent coproporphyrinogen-3 oxidase [Dysgonomonas sp. PH5-37]
MAGIYIHVPFCKTRCIYCDFFSQTDMGVRRQYVDAVCREAELRKDYMKNEPVETIYFGGGTPSQLNVNEIGDILKAIKSQFDLTALPEITIEANPDDLNPDYLSAIKNLGINRISIGIQSFNDKELSFLNRRHSAQQAIKAVEQSKEAGFSNISIDLIYGLPNQTLDIWKANLEQAVELNVRHISAYHLIYEEGTALHDLQQAGKITSVDEETSVQMFSVMIDRLREAGYMHYEISNFAKPDFYSRHNSSYWQGTAYLGLGSAAHSFNGENRSFNVASIARYLQGIDEGKPYVEVESLDRDTRYNEFILTGLRTMWGVDLNELVKRFGAERRDYCLVNAEAYLQSNMLRLENDRLYLTQNGIFLSDRIMSDLMWV